MATRDLTPAVLASLDDDVIYPFFAVELLFDEGTYVGIDNTSRQRILRLWTGVGTLVFEGQDWVGTGNLLQIDSVEETTEIAAKGASVTLTGVPQEVLSLALREQYQGRKANIYFGNFSSKGSLLTEGSGSGFILQQDGSKIELEDLSTNLSQIFSGYMDQMNIEEGPETCTVQLTLENKLVDLERPRVARFTSAYQKSIYSGDKGLEFVEGLQDKEIVWGRKSGN